MRPRIGGYASGTILLCLLYPPSSTLAVDGVVAAVGSGFILNGDNGTTLYGIGTRWDWGRRWFTTGNWFLGGYWELNAGYWDGQSGSTGNSSLAEVGITPAFRLQRYQPLASGMRPYFDFAVGAHLLSKHDIDNQALGSSFLFGSYAGLGIRFGPAGRYELGYRVEHFSNGGIAKRNEGINFHTLQLGYHF